MTKAAQWLALGCLCFLFIPDDARVAGQNRDVLDTNKRLKAEVAVYTEVLRELRLRWISDGRPVPRPGDLAVVVVAQTVDLLQEWWWNAPGKVPRPCAAHIRVPDASDAVIEDLCRANQKQRDLSGAFGSDSHVITMPRSRLIELFRTNNAWEAFYASYPGSAGYVEFSRAGLSQDGATALVYVGHVYGGLAGEGCFCVLRRNGDRWNVESPHRVWVS